MLSLLNHSRRSLLSSLPSTRSPPKTWTRSYQVDTTTTTTNKKAIIHDAIIIGGGPTGLLLSNLLSSHNIHSHLLFDKRPVTELLQHPQAHFINVRSMEILKAELPNVYEAVVREMPDVGEWDGFHFGGSVLQQSQVENDDDGGGQLQCSDYCLGGGRRLGRVSHPVREPLRVGQRGDAILAGGIDNPTMTNDDAPPVSSCRPAHLAQNKFVALLMQEARRHCHLDDQDEIHDAGNNKTNNHHLRYGEEVVRISEHSSSSNNSNSYNNIGNHPSPLITIHTSQGQSYHTRYLLAADGVNSFTRKQFGIPMMGEDSMQNLINVHFRTNGTLSELLMRRSSSSPTNHHNQAMLHFVYNSHLVGAFVCHDGNKGEWVLQIPFFPPFQTMENDFDAGKVRDMIWAGLVGDVLHPETNTTRNMEDSNFNFEILSIRPWTMSSLVAQRYLNESKNMILVGDAAHAFPPAGGFGMNTGLQDAHNIAWRLALLLNREKRNEVSHLTLEHGKDMPDPRNETIEPSSSSSRSAPTTSFSNAILSKYDQERKPIATQNAALSVRNYQRTLRIAKACYLDAQHPQLLISMLNSLPMNMLPLETRQDMFRKLVSVAMMPLGSLVSSPKSGGMQSGRHSFHADHIEKNVMSILKSGGSLPLVFPRYELGFSYNPNRNVTTSERSDAAATNNDEIGGDTAGYFPRLKVGHRMPHVSVEVLAFSSAAGKDGVAVLETLNHCQTASNSDLEDANTDDRPIHISLSDISSQLRRAHSCPSPVFTLIAFGPALTSSLTLIGEAVDCVMKKWNVPLMLVSVLPARPDDVYEHQNKVRSSTDDDSRNGRESRGFNVLYTVDTEKALLQLLHDVEPALAHNTKEQMQQKQNDSKAVNALIMVRPDGHIANISWIDEREGVEKIVSKQIERVMEQGFQNALGGDILLED